MHIQMLECIDTMEPVCVVLLNWKKFAEVESSESKAMFRMEVIFEKTAERYANYGRPSAILLDWAILTSQATDVLPDHDEFRIFLLQEAGMKLGGRVIDLSSDETPALQEDEMAHLKRCYGPQCSVVMTTGPEEWKTDFPEVDTLESSVKQLHEMRN